MTVPLHKIGERIDGINNLCSPKNATIDVTLRKLYTQLNNEIGKAIKKDRALLTNIAK